MVRSKSPTRRSSINNTLQLASAFPVSRLMVPMRPSLFPTIRNPAVAVTLMDVTPGNPDVGAAPPLPKSRRPYKPYLGRRYGFDANRRRRDIDIDEHSRRRNAGRADRSRGYDQAQQQGLEGNFHFMLLPDV